MECDFTGDTGESVTVCEVYEIGGLYPEENKDITCIYISERILPPYSEHLTMYVDENNNFVLMRDDNKTWKSEQVNNIIINKFKNVLRTIEKEN